MDRDALGKAIKRSGEKDEKMKKALSLVIALCLLFSFCMAEEAPDAPAGSPAELPSLWDGGETHTIEKKAMTMYVSSLNSQWPE